jgi:protein-tyrosine-phosphatase
LQSDPDVLLVLCTGNAARSVIAAAALRSHDLPVVVETRGTFVVDGQPISGRTRAALNVHGLEADRHRSRQVTADDVERAAWIIAMAPEHVEYVRRVHPGASAKTATLVRLVETIGATRGPLSARIDALEVDKADLQPWEEVVDPGGGDADSFIACASQIVALVDRLAPTLRATAERESPVIRPDDESRCYVIQE